MSVAKSFLDFKSPRVFTIPSGENFQLAVARGIRAALEPRSSVFALHDTIVLAPTRRMVRTLADAFLQRGGQAGATLLPQILPLGDVDIDEAPFVLGELPLTIKTAISQNRRLFCLAQIIQHRAKTSAEPVSLSSALAEATAIAALLDSAAHEGITDFALASTDFADFLAHQPAHIGRAARFLDIVSTYWPAFLREENLIDPATRRVKMLDALADEGTKNPTQKTIIAAGSTGSQRATANLLRVVAGLPNGCVILPGLDRDIDQPAWAQILEAPGHPQHGMSRLLETLAMPREAVQLWPQATSTQRQARRRRIINEALTPAETTSDWLDRLEVLGTSHKLAVADLMQDALDGLALIEAANEDEEAHVLALAVRETLATPTQTVMLVTPDRALARRVRAALQNWQIDVDDSAGTPLPEDRLGVFLGLVLNWWSDPGEPVALLALLTHPFSCVGRTRAQVYHLSRLLDIAFLRGVRRHKDLADLAKNIMQSDHKEKQDIAQLLLDLHQINAYAGTEPNQLISAFATLHASLAEQLAATDTGLGAEHVWRGKAGDIASQLFRSLIDDSRSVGATHFADYRRLYDFFARQVSVRPNRPKGGRVRILGPLEARQQTADLVLLGGLDEGVWPKGLGTDPFLPNSLVRKLGLPDPERRLGLSAHDFAETTCKANVLLTRSAKRGGTPTIASRWVWRLKTLCEAAAGENWPKLLRPKTDYLQLARQLVHVPHVHPAAEPRPTPPVSARPKGLYVTRIKTLIRNPYAIYGQKILRLQALDQIGQPPGPRERGTAIHHALDVWHKHPQTGEFDAKVCRLTALITDALLDAGFRISDLAIEGSAAKRIARAYVSWATRREENGTRIAFIERSGSLKISVAGEQITLSAKSDRIDQTGTDWAILDYKTGAPPTPKEVCAGFDPQLPLTAAILQGGGFGDCPGDVTELLYVQLSGGQTPLKIKQIKPDKKGPIASLSELIALEQQRVLELFHEFAKPQTPYLCQPRAKYTDAYSDFDLLARRAEWSAVLSDKDFEP